MAIVQPTSTTQVGTANHSLMHRVFAIDSAAPVKKVVVDGDGSIFFGDYDGSNAFKVTAGGVVSLLGDTRVKKQIPISNASLGKGGIVPTQIILGNYNGWEFDIDDDSVFTFHLPHDWEEGTDVVINIDWYINEAGGDKIQWRIDWSATSHDAVEPVDSPTHTGNSSTGDIIVPATVKYLTQDGLTIPGGSLSMDDQVGIKLSRITAGGTPPTNKPTVVDIHIEYTVNKLGEAL